MTVNILSPIPTLLLLMLAYHIWSRSKTRAHLILKWRHIRLNRIQTLRSLMELKAPSYILNRQRSMIQDAGRWLWWLGYRQ